MNNKYEAMQDWELEREVQKRLGHGDKPRSHEEYHNQFIKVTRNLSQAWGLPLPEECSIRLETFEGRSRVGIFAVGRANTRAVISTNPARAVCIAWLLYKDAQEDG